MGLFLMPWDAVNMFAQITHIIITLNVAWLLFVFIKEQKYKALGKGLLAGILIFVPIFAVIQSYTQSHLNEFLRVLSQIK